MFLRGNIPTLMCRGHMSWRWISSLREKDSIKAMFGHIALRNETFLIWHITH